MADTGLWDQGQGWSLHHALMQRRELLVFVLVIKTFAPVGFFWCFVGVLVLVWFFFLFGSFIDSESSTSTNWLTNNYKTSCREIEAGCWFPPSFTSVSFQSNVSSMLLIKFAVCGLCAKLGRVTLPRRKMTVEQAVHRLSRALQGN